MTPGELLAAYVHTGHQLTVLVTPYALHLWYFLSILELAALSLNYMTEQDSVAGLFSRGMRFIFMAGFAYWWIQNAWTLATTVLGSFDQLGQAITGIPQL